MKRSIKEKEHRFWDRFARWYDVFINRTVGDAYYQMYSEFKNDISQNDEVLEVATGTGLLAFEISLLAQKITATDISPEMIRLAILKQQKENYQNIYFEVADCCSIPYKNASFDVVIASNVLHLLHEPEMALTEIKRLLKASGRVILPTFCHAENVKSRLISHFMHIWGFRANHKWNVKGYISFIENAGFIILKTKVIQSKIPLVYLVVK